MSVTYKRMGNHGVLISNLCLGTMNFGWTAPEDECHRIMDRALELGINFFDTADVYGGNGADGAGLTEEIIGRWLARGSGRRDAIVLASKVYSAVQRPDRRPEPNACGPNLSALKITRHCEASLQRLQTDRIDLYQMHHIDRACPWREIWQTFGALQTQGKVIYTGSSNFAGWDIATACQEARNHGMMGLSSEQSLYNLNNRAVELEVIPACRHYGLGLMPWSPLGGGILAGVLGKIARGRRQTQELAAAATRHRDKLARFETLCREISAEPSVVALAWLLHNPAVTAPVIGPRTVEQLESAVRATELSLDEETLQRLDEIFPGPGGEAPAAYAW